MREQRIPVMPKSGVTSAGFRFLSVAGLCLLLSTAPSWAATGISSGVPGGAASSGVPGGATRGFPNGGVTAGVPGGATTATGVPGGGAFAGLPGGSASTSVPGGATAGLPNGDVSTGIPGGGSSVTGGIPGANTPPPVVNPPQPAVTNGSILVSNAVSFRSMDVNGDGIVTASEFAGSGLSPDVFGRLDASQDGFLTNGEFNRINVLMRPSRFRRLIP